MIEESRSQWWRTETRCRPTMGLNPRCRIKERRLNDENLSKHKCAFS